LPLFYGSRHAATAEWAVRHILLVMLPCSEQP